MKESNSRYKRNDDSGTVRSGKGMGPLPYDDMVPQVKLAILKSAHMKAMTYSPKSDRVYDLDVISQARDLFWEIVGSERHMNPSLPIHLIAVTCHTSTEMDDIMRSAYNHASLWVNQPLIGTWIDEAGDKFTDVVIPIQQ